MRKDLSQVDSSPGSRLVVDPGAAGLRLRLVRTLGPIEEARAFDSSSVGLLEVAYASVPDPAANDPALEVVRRAAVPVDGEMAGKTVFAKDYFDRATGGFAERAADLVGGVLLFGLEMAAPEGEMLQLWDSTRSEFLDRKRFPLALGGAVPARERVFPRRIRVTIVLEREERDRRTVRVASVADATDTRLALDDPRPLEVAEGDLVKIGAEWMSVAASEPRALRVRKRGELGTPAASVAQGRVVHRGRTFVAEVPLDTWREADLR
jgi:hypothetical protein